MAPADILLVFNFILVFSLTFTAPAGVHLGPYRSWPSEACGILWNSGEFSVQQRHPLLKVF